MPVRWWQSRCSLCGAGLPEVINNGMSIEADAVLGLTTRVQRFGGYATDEVAHVSEPFDDRHHLSGSSRSTWSTSMSAPATPPARCFVPSINR